MPCHACAFVRVRRGVLSRRRNGKCVLVSSIERTEDLFAQEENTFLTIATFSSVQR